MIISDALALTEFKEGIAHYYHAFIANCPKVLIGIVVFLIFLGIGGIFQRILFRILLKRMSDRLLGTFLSKVMLWVFIIIGFSIFLNIVGWGKIAGGILAGAGIGAVIIGLAFRDLGENLLSGVFLDFSRPFNIGDVVETNGIIGKVTEVSLRNTHLKTFDGKDTYIPNNMVIKNVLSNRTIDGYMRYDFDLNIETTSDVLKTIRIATETMQNIPGVLNNEIKQPLVTFTEIRDNSLLLKVYFWIDTYNNDTSVFDIKTRSLVEVINALKKEGVMFPDTVIRLNNTEEHPLGIHMLK